MRSLLVGFLVTLMGILTGLLATFLFHKPEPYTQRPLSHRVTRPLPKGPLGTPEAENKAQEGLSPGPDDRLDGGEAFKTKMERPEDVDPLPQLEPSPQATEATNEPREETGGEPLRVSPSFDKSANLPAKAPSKRSSRQRLRSGGEPFPQKADEERPSAQYALHLGSFKDHQLASRMIQKIQELGFEGSIERVNIPGKGEFHRVLAVGFPDKASARAELERLISQGVIKEGRVVGLKDAKR